jgi:hypothetical protein
MAITHSRAPGLCALSALAPPSRSRRAHGQRSGRPRRSAGLLIEVSPSSSGSETAGAACGCGRSPRLGSEFERNAGTARPPRGPRKHNGNVNLARSAGDGRVRPFVLAAA